MSELLQNHNFNFKKKYGQNFLQDVKIPRRIAMECTNHAFPEGDVIPDEKADSLILEIGPGAGILTKEFDDKTMESRIIPGLYACGEVLDIDGDCGGYNLQWAWSSGRLAGSHAGGNV